MTSVPRCPRCGQPLAILEDGKSCESYCPDCLGFRPTWPSFDAFMAAVDEVLVRKCGVSSADLPDCCYRDWFDGGMTAGEAADNAIEESMS
jgi:hypothetical protein